MIHCGLSNIAVAKIAVVTNKVVSLQSWQLLSQNDSINATNRSSTLFPCRVDHHDPA
jgi:hypothetical protein